MKEFDEIWWLGLGAYLPLCCWFAGVRSCYDEGKRTAETLAMDYHRGADVQVHLLDLVQGAEISKSFFWDPHVPVRVLGQWTW